MVKTTVSFWNFAWGLVVSLAFFPIFGWISFALLLIAAVDHYFTEYTVTDRRVLVKRGVVRRRTYELSLARVEGINLGQSVIGRILGYGTVRVGGTGGESVIVTMVQDPVAFRTLVMNEVDKAGQLR